MLHGASASATVNITGGYAGAWYFDSIARNGFASQVLGSDLGAASPPRSVVNMGTARYWGYNGSWDWQYYTGALAFIKLQDGSEFAVNTADRGIHAYQGARSGDLGSSTATDDLLIETPQTLAGNGYASTIKIDGAQPIDLGGNTLILGWAGSYPAHGYADDPGGGLLQTGANNPVGITNGTIQIQKDRNGADRYLYVQGDKDLTISANVNGAGITKMGSGKLTLNGSVAGLNPPGANYKIRWIEGGLDINVAEDFSLGVDQWAGGWYGVEPNASLVKRGTNTVNMGANWFANYSTGGITVVQGTLIGGRFGYGPLTIQSGATATQV